MTLFWHFSDPTPLLRPNLALKHDFLILKALNQSFKKAQKPHVTLEHLMIINNLENLTMNQPSKMRCYTWTIGQNG